MLEHAEVGLLGEAEDNWIEYLRIILKVKEKETEINKMDVKKLGGYKWLYSQK